jgi:hydroxymethylpyrimidine pyrophosphatase-like HAD family hydrolase
MRYLAFASSFDETIASDGRVPPATLAALRRLVASGRQLVLLSRRTVDQLAAAVPHDLFACVVAEYGGVLWWPATEVTRPLARRLGHPLVRELADRGVEPLSAGEVALATDAAHEGVVRQVVEAQGLDMTVVSDKDMVLAVPAGVDKATGLAAALGELGLSFHNVVGIGDADSDLAFLRRCECAVAVANAPPAVRDRCDLVVEGDDGQAVVTLIDRLVGGDLADAEPRLDRHRLLLGNGQEGAVAVQSYGANVLLAGSSGTGKSRLAAGLLERLTERDYQFCVLDPEGDHAGLEGAVTLGDRSQAPSVERIITELEVPGRRVVVNLLAIRLEQLPGFLKDLLGPLQELRSGTGRPHMLMLDEAHHFLPLPGHHGAFVLPRWVDGLIMATVNPEHVSPTALSLANSVVVFGEGADGTLRRYCEAIGEASPLDDPVDLEPGQALAWTRAGDHKPVVFEIAAGTSQRRPHLRRWAESELSEEKRFWFRGPQERLRLGAPTLAMFVHIGEGVDADTWLHHLERGDYSAWMRDGIRDETLASQVATIEREAAGYDDPVQDSRRRIFAAIRERYLQDPA